MRLRHDPETDSAYIKFEPQGSTESFELCEDIVIDLDADEHVVGIEIHWASRKFDVARMRAILEGEPARASPRPKAPRPPGKPVTIQKKGIG